MRASVVVMPDVLGEDLFQVASGEYEQVVEAVLPDSDIDNAAWLAQRGFLLQALVRTVAVIVPRVLGQHLPQVLLAEDQHMI
jgi:hypothetical protein